jgi:transcriptional antiterminator Rof (Rho-off)
MKYHPVSCSLYDRIESLVVTHRKVKIICSTENLTEQTINGKIDNVYSENNSEYLLINNVKIRLDRIKSISEH